ncbi:MAG: heavy-metal-associated domain-containing protein [Bacteroidetes bacterium]|nr:heavy-metal-associated domain-containing protein [Bacteroidota bacterium]
MKTVHKLKIEGMHCMNSCVRSVKEELNAIPEVKIINVLVGEAEIEYDDEVVSSKQLTAAISEAGFKLIDVN